MAEPRQVVEAIRVHERTGRGQVLWGAMMVEDDDIEADCRCGLQGRVSARAAIDGDQQCSAVLPQSLDGGDVGAIAFGDSVRNVDLDDQAEATQVAGQERGAGCTVDIVISEYRHSLAGQNSAREPLGSRRHIDQAVRVRHQVAHSRLQIRLRFGRSDAAPGQDPGQQLGQAMRLHHRRRVSLEGRIGAAVAPGPAENRVGDVEERARRVEGEGG
ncbi:hypothetical protein ASG51_14835 [Methylobacterium sp. Leaf465]|nr:hypothetical protein ASG51_14835 [Methylobacterium sp. Leaf465]